jgi:tripartite-type tricarboxylate transporter receptor subunit TctC
MSDHATIDRRAALALLGGLAAAPLAQAQTSFPTKPISLLVPFAPGRHCRPHGARRGRAHGRSLGQPVVVENKPSAGSIVASQAVATAGPTATRCC